MPFALNPPRGPRGSANRSTEAPPAGPRSTSGEVGPVPPEDSRRHEMLKHTLRSAPAPAATLP
eukprot:1290643-Alexandrium_andersonii.AAC.1